MENDAPAQVDEAATAQGVRSKAHYHKLASDYLNQALQLDKTWSVNILTRGELLLNAGSYDEALQPFQTVLNQSSDENLFAQIGKARVLYHKKNYQAALLLYQKVLFGRSDFQPDPRIGIGLCFWKLNDREGALAAWQRALELSPDNETVNTLLGIYYMTMALEHPESPDFAHSYAKGLEHVQAAFKKNSNFAVSGIALSSYLYSKKDMDSALKLLKRAATTADLSSIFGEIYFWMGRAYHYLQDYEQALKYYTLSEEKTRASYLPALIGKGLVQMAQESPEALLTFESCVNSFPKSLDALLILGLLTALRAGSDAKRKTRATVLLDRYLSVCKEKGEVPSTQAFLVMSTLYESTNIDKAESYLNMALEQYEEEDENATDKAFLYNNLATFQYFRGSYEEAEKNYKLAKELCNNSTTQREQDAEVTITFNTARLYDAWGQPEKALELYQKVLELAPNYLDASIRLTYLNVVLNKDSEVDSVKELMEQADDNLEVRSFYGWWLRRQKRGSSKNMNEDVEQRHYKYSLVDVNKHDTYSLVALGNLYVTAAREVRTSKPGDQEKKDKLYFKAAEFFDKALQIDPANAYAAQGIAIIFAETKRAELALHIFGKIRESIGDISIYINLGHCLAELRQFVKSIEVYEYALDKFGGGPNDGQLMTLLGRAWYARGLSEKNLSAYKTALDYSQKALDKSPSNPGLKFNVAYVQFQMADLLRKMPEASRSISDLEEGIAALENSISSLNDLAKVKYPPFPPSELEQRALMGQNTLRKQLDRALLEQQEYEEHNKTKVEEARKIREEAVRKRQEAEAARKKDEEDRQAKLAEERRKLQEEAMQWTEAARMAAEEEAENAIRIAEGKKEARRAKSEANKEKRSKGGSGKGKKGKKAKDEEEPSPVKNNKYKSDEFIVDSDEEEEGYSGASSRGDDDDDDAGLFGDEEGDESDSEKKRKVEENNDSEEAVPSKKRRTNRIDDEEEDDYDAEPVESEPKKRGNVIQDDEDDEEMQ